MTNDDDERALRDIIDRRGSAFVQQIAQDVEAIDLTIVSNAGIHPIPPELVVGELYIASSGNLDFSTIETVNSEYDNIILRLHEKLVEKRWGRVFLIPFGHTTLCMNIKLAVYRTLRIETIDNFYFGNGRYGVLSRDTRALLASMSVDD
jgi:hypothetical protein